MTESITRLAPRGVLLAAALSAECALSVRKAIDAAWMSMHISGDPIVMRDAFHAWSASEGMVKFTCGYDVSGLGEILRRRYKKATPAAIANSLRRAADLFPSVD